MRAIRPGLAAIGLIALAACEETAQSPDLGTMPVAAEGEALFMEYCAACHGEDATGDGPLGRSLNIAPADLTRIVVRRGGSFPRAQVLSKVDGYARSDMDVNGMPEFGALMSGDLVPYDSGDGIETPTPRKLVALVEYLESIQKAP
ncbi:cytochrome C [Roseivivax halodurans JCM 10272]|uniref:Cytochrome C n=1 Tax=Roseivivax halodurans JCM 10272 TaxID=1449350 RepID=X7ED47_9RHOB|nr:cytochrome c [Roseivivax halodurans]ETX13043.1 cytochrome C [Roseivivax halodurans JCM 10272]